MNERSRNFETTPDKLNNELLMILQQFPQSLPPSQTSEGNGFDLLSERQPVEYDPELRNSIKKGITHLLDQSMLGAATRKLYERPIEIALDYGIDKERIEKEDLFKLFGFDIREPDGVFNSFNIFEISRRLILHRSEMARDQRGIGKQIEFDYELSAAIAELTS